MKIKHLLASAILAIGGGNLWAQTDVTSTYITNADFSSTTGWTQYKSDSFSEIGTGLIGWNVKNYASTTDATHLSTEYCFGFEMRWGDKTDGTYSSYYQETSAALPTGSYELTFDVQNTNTATSAGSYSSKFYVKIGDNTYSDSKTEWMNANGSPSWTTHTITFTITEAAKATISLGYGAGSTHNKDANTPVLYVSHLKLMHSPFADATDYEALNAAISTVEGTAWGFDAGEYAPYNYVEVIEALAAAKAIDQTANNSQVTVQALTATLNTSMTANADEVNAIWDPSFEYSYSTSGNVQPIAWTGTSGHDNATDVRWMWNVNSNAGLGATSSSKALFTKYGVHYGQQAGYTLPLNANTYYTLGFKYGGWSDCKKDGYVTMSDPASASLSILASNRLPLDAVDGNSNTASWKTYTGIFKTNDAGNYVLGLRKDNENQQSQYVYGDFVLKATTVAEATAYYNTKKAAVEGDYDADANGGSEKTTFKAALDASVPSTVAEIMEAAANFASLRDAFVAAVSTFDALAAELTKAENLGVDAETRADNTATASTTAAEAATYIQNLKVAEYNYVTTNYAHGVNLGTWTTEGPTGSLHDQHWSGESREYLEQSSAAWGQNAWSIKYSQNVTLPAGSYVFKVAGRQAASDAVTLSLEVKNGETVLGTVSDFPKADTGLGINTSGATDYSTSSTYANNNAGRGWEWRYVKFTLNELSTVNVAVSAVATDVHMWVSFCDATVQATSADVAALLSALATYDAALAAANAAKDNTDYSNVQGLELTSLQNAINADDSLDKSSLSAVEAATSTLTTTTATFTAAKDSYDAFAAAKAAEVLTKFSTNVGTGVFQYNTTTNDELYTAYETAKNTVDNFTVSEGTASAVLGYANQLTRATEAYQNQELNAPASGKKYYITVATPEHAKRNNAWLLAAGVTSANNPTGYTISANSTPAAYLSQAFTFKQVEANNYNISIELDGTTVYLTNGAANASAANWANWQIQGTTDETKAMAFTIVAGDANNTFYIVNATTGTTVSCQVGGNIYTDGDANKYFSLTEASQAEVTVSCKPGKFGTVIFPFTPALTGNANVKFYTVTGINNGYVQLDEVATNALMTNTPYMLKNEGASDYSEVVQGWGVATQDSYTVNDLTGVYTVAPIAASTDAKTNYVLQTQDDVQAFYKVDADFNATANKCYLSVTASNDVKAFYLDFNSADAIQGVEATNAENAVIYNLAGQRMSGLKRGINIVNGKKVLVK